LGLEAISVRFETTPYCNKGKQTDAELHDGPLADGRVEEEGRKVKGRRALANRLSSRSDVQEIGRHRDVAVFLQREWPQSGTWSYR
jgi:hypothetical protein